MKKNLSKTQIEIEELSKRVPKLTNKQREWAIHNYTYSFHHIPPKGECVCPNCKGKVPMEKTDSIQKQVQKLRCPVCGAKIETHRYFDGRETNFRKREMNHHQKFFQVMNVVGDWQVTRLFLMERWTYVRKGNSDWAFYECCQAWNSPKVMTTHFRSLPKTGIGCNWHYNPYSIHTWRYECTNPDMRTYNKYIECDNELEARMPGGANYFDMNALCPDAKILPFYKQRGLNATAYRTIKSFGPMALMEGMSRNAFPSMQETLIKCGGYEVFNKITERNNYIDRNINKDAYFTAWKICQRNGYNYRKNATEWIDMVGLLIELGLDYHSPHYVCPDDIHKMHQRLLRLSERREDEKLLESLAKENARYKERIQKYLNLCFRYKDLTIKVLPDIPAFKKEGEHLGHCVYRCKYYNKVDSLILSARGKHGKRWETIEVSLKDFKILQCYGYADKHTSRHQEIINLVNENMWRIKDCKRGKKSNRGKSRRLAA